MTFAERLARWNSWYDRAPEMWRFQYILWPLLILGAINMALTIAIGMPFALLVVLGILVVACIRVPYVLGWVKVDSVEGGASKIQIVAQPWVYRINKWYDGLSELRRPMVILGVLLVAGAINMALTINSGFSFGIIFLLTLLALLAIRGPYAAGWLLPPHGEHDRLTGPSGQIARDTTTTAHVASERVAVTHDVPPAHSGEDYS